MTQSAENTQNVAPASDRLSRSIGMHPGWIMLAITYPAIFTGLMLGRGLSLTDALQVQATTQVILLPVLAAIAAICGHFRPWHAGLALFIYIAYDRLWLRDIIVAATDGFLDYGSNPNWALVAIMLLCTGLGVAALLWRPTFFRVLTCVAAFAQITTLALFHNMFIDRPLEVASETESRFLHGFINEQANLQALCGIDGRDCRIGAPEQIVTWAREAISAPASLIRILEDTAERPALLHVWTEAAFTDIDNAMMRHIAFHKTAPDKVLVLINETAPSRAFDQMRLGFNALTMAFIQIWTALLLFILWRHGDLVWRNRRWQRLALPR